MDDGFAYAVPDAVSGVEVGTMVRVPLGGRRVKGYVTSVRTATPDRPLRSILARSGELPVFNRGLLETARWVSTHYVAPLSVVLARTAPPNLPRMVADPVFDAPVVSSTELAAWADTQIRVGRTRPRYVVSGQPPVPLIAPAISPVVSASQNVLVCAPTVEEAAATASGLGELFGDRVMMATSPSSPADRTNAWSLAAGEAGVVIVGTREIAFWGAGSVGLAVIIEEGRRAYKARQTPTYHVRDVLRRRSAIERFGLLLVGAVPTTEVIAAGVELGTGNGRVWPLVEVVDRAEAAPGSGLIMERTRIAIGAALRADESVFVLVPRRGYAGAFRCVRCKELRRCTNCGARLEQSGTCQRCGTEHGACASCGGTRFEPLGAGIGRVVDDLRRSFGESVGEAGSATSVRVGTERDLVDLEPVDLAVAIDADGMMLAPHYRAAEDALRILVRLTLATTAGRGRKALIQTAIPDHPVITALRLGRPFPFLDDELEERAGSGFPPVGALLAVETDAPLEVAEPAMQAVGRGATVLGPAAWAGGHRWLLQGGDLSEVRIRLRSVVQALRDSGSRVRVDADPLDL